MFVRTLTARYLLPKTKQKGLQLVQVLSGLSLAGITVGTASLVVVLSVYNGLESLVSTLFSAFDPTLKITATNGKPFEVSRAIDKLTTLDISDLSIMPTLEEQVLLRHRGREYVATIKGVPESFFKRTELDSHLVEGQLITETSEGEPVAVIGAGVAIALSLSMGDMLTPLQIYAPRRGKVNLANPTEAFAQRMIAAGGIFDVQSEVNSKYVLVPLEFARELLDRQNQASSLEITLWKSVTSSDIKRAQKLIATSLGAQYQVKDRYEQQEAIYRIFKSEKWWTYFVLSCLLALAALNLIGSMTMVIVEKKADIGVFRALGANAVRIKRVFFMQGLVIAFAGAFAGLWLGVALCWAQTEFNLVQLSGGANYLIQSYPVKVLLTDLVAIMGAVSVVGIVCAWVPTRVVGMQYATPKSIGVSF